MYTYIYIYIYTGNCNTCSVDIKSRLGLQHNMHSAKKGAGIQAPYVELMQVQHTCGMGHSYATWLQYFSHDSSKTQVNPCQVQPP